MRQIINYVTFLFLIIGFSYVSAEKIDVIVYADANYPPYSFKDGGEAAGIYTEILKVAFSRMENYRVKIIPVPWKRGLNKLENGKGFALYPPYYHTKEFPFIWPYSLPIMDETVVAFCSEEVLSKSLRTRWPEDYYGLTFGNNAGFVEGGDIFWQAVKENKIHVSEARGNRQNILKLARGRIDCYINDRVSVLWELQVLKDEGEYKEGKQYAKLVEGATVSLNQGFLGFTNRDQGRYTYKEDFVKQFNTVIYEMQKSRELQNIINVYLNSMDNIN